MDVDATLLEDGKTLRISQHIAYVNASNNSQRQLYLYDWINAFSDKNSALAQSFSEEFVRRFHFASDYERGGTTVKGIEHQGDSIFWKRPLNYPDVIQVKLPYTLEPGEVFHLDLEYDIVIPDAKFTNFGVDQYGIALKYWLIKPALHKDKWYVYSHRKVYDMPQQSIDLTLKFTHPVSYELNTSLSEAGLKQTINGINKTLEFARQDIVDTDIHLLRVSTFEKTKTEYCQLVTNVSSDDLQPEVKSLITFRILQFLNEKLGDYPFEKLLVSEQDYQIAPVYGLNQLPSFLKPYPNGFIYDIKMIKAITVKYLRNTMLMNTRKDAWILDAIQVNLMMEYVDTYYSEVKLAGKLSNFLFLDWLHISDLKFNYQYDYLVKNVTRNNINQSLDTPQDSLIKFNQKIANPYLAGMGLRYLKDYANKAEIDYGIKEFYNNQKLKFSNVDDYRRYLSSASSQNIDWYFEDFVSTPSPLDFKIKSVKKKGDSLEVKILNKKKSKLPVSLFWIKDNVPIGKVWVKPFDSITEVKIPRMDADRLGLNYDAIIPEENKRNNYKRVSTWLNKPFQFRLLLDIEDPKYSQLFVRPEFTYNLYDGFTVGPGLYNKTFLPRQFSYRVTPKYGFKSQDIVGSASIRYTAWQHDKDLYGIAMGMSGSRFSYDFDLFYERFQAFLALLYRDNEDRRNNKRQQLSFRTLNIRRDRSPLVEVNEPDYNVFNIKYVVQNKNLDRFYNASVDFELSQKFSKLFGTYAYRRLNENNRQFNFRVFAGVFLFNDTDENSDFFSFALDRPSDYMFDYNYYGRSEDSGLFSQQFIMAEGGFKSQLQPDFANQWLLTTNVSYTIWNWIFAYADAGFVGNKGQSGKFLYDSGVKMVLVEDYFELFFPVYSSNGWEFQSNYDERIRFIVSLDLSTLFRLFTRRWY